MLYKNAHISPLSYVFDKNIVLTGFTAYLQREKPLVLQTGICFILKLKNLHL